MMSISIFCFDLNNCAAQYLKNVISLGSNDIDRGAAIATDKDANIILVGSFSSSNVDFDPSINTHQVEYASGKDIFIAKYNAKGLLQWAIGIGGADDDEAKAVAVDNTGNIYVTGYAGESSVDYDPSSKEVTHQLLGGKDVFIAKYSPAGAHLWSTQLGGSDDEEGLGIALDNSDNVYVTGYFLGSNADFNTSGTASLLTSEGMKDIFYLRYSTSGSYRWAGSVGGSKNDEGQCIVVDKGPNNVYIGGYFSGAVDFNADAGTNPLQSVGASDAFIAKYNSSGSYQWAMGIGGSSSDECRGIAIDSNSQICACGVFSGSNADFNPVGGTVKFSSKGFSDIFVSKYKTTGSYVGALTIGGSMIDEPGAICVDKDNSIILTGAVPSSGADFDPSTQTKTVDGTGAFFAKYTSGLSLEWVYSLASLGSAGTGIAVDKSKNVTATGYYAGDAKFDPRNRNAITTSSDATFDIFATTISPTFVSVDAAPIENKISVYPNPCTDMIIVSGSQMPGFTKAIVYDELGRLRATQYWENSESEEHSIDIHEFSSGWYSVIICTGLQQTQLPFYKQ